MAFSRTVTINLTDKNGIVECLRKIDVTRAHFTNGTFMMPADKIIPTVLAGFQHASEQSQGNEAFVLALNSDQSMARMMDAKNATAEERASLESQLVRAHKVAAPLQLQHPDRDIVVLFYDEDTPTPLYDYLVESDAVIAASLHKWGYGTEPNAPRIEGAYNFGAVYAHPLPHDERPVCYDLTERGNQSGTVKVVKLTEEIGLHGSPYISNDGKLLFPLKDASLQKYGAATSGAAPAGGMPPPSIM